MAENQLRSILKQHGRLSVDIDSVTDDDNLYSLGLTSHASVAVMLAVEDEFRIEFPDECLKKSTFESVSAIAQVVKTLREAE